MVKNNTLFYLSGFFSLLLFTIFLVLFLWMMFKSDKMDMFALNKDTYISISLETPKVNTKKTKKSVEVPPVEEVSTAETKEVNIEDMFSEVLTKDIKKIQKIKPKQENKRIQQIQKRIETKKTNEASRKTEQVKSTDNSMNNEENTPDSTANEVNEYFAKIHALVYQNFNVPENTQGNTVKAVIELSAIGKVLDFRILSYSANSLLNEEADKLKSRLSSIVFPINPKNKSGSYIILLTSKE